MEAQSFHVALDAAALAMIALRADGHILAASPSAEFLLGGKDVIVGRRGRLCAVDVERDRTLQLLINRAARTSGIDLVGTGGRSVEPGGAMLLPQAGRPLAFQVQVLPVRASARGWGSDPAVLVFIADPGASLPNRAQVFKGLYQLTPLESRLANLFLRGIELKQAADKLRLTYESTRFHLKQIFRKTNTTKQTELLRLLLALTV